MSTKSGIGNSRKIDLANIIDVGANRRQQPLPPKTPLHPILELLPMAKMAEYY